jgi:hypothetical protein
MNEIERLREKIARTRSIALSQLEETTESNEPPKTPPPTKKRKKRGGNENLDDFREYLNKARGMERLEHCFNASSFFRDKTNSVKVREI